MLFLLGNNEQTKSGRIRNSLIGLIDPRNNLRGFFHVHPAWAQTIGWKFRARLDSGKR